LASNFGKLNKNYIIFLYKIIDFMITI